VPEGVTFNFAVAATPLADVAVIVTNPAATPVATPFASTVAMAASLLDQVNVVLVGLFDASSAVAVNVVVTPTVTPVESGEMVTLATGAAAAPH
jgi:hypothetical protein